ncbi:hypothetical protein Tco_1476130 [Tanacetum coccineum]
MRLKKINIEGERALNVRSWRHRRIGIWMTTQSTARQSTITPKDTNFEEEAGPSSPLRPIQVMDSEEQLKAAEVLVSISRPRGLSIPGPHNKLTSTSNQGTDPKDKAKWDTGFELDAKEERKRFEELKKTKSKTTLKKPTSLAQERNQMMSFLKGQGYKNLQKLKERNKGMLKEKEMQKDSKEKEATISKNSHQKNAKLRTETIDDLRNYLAERRYPLSESYERMLEHGMEGWKTKP